MLFFGKKKSKKEIKMEEFETLENLSTNGIIKFCEDDSGLKFKISQSQKFKDFFKKCGKEDIIKLQRANFLSHHNAMSTKKVKFEDLFENEEDAVYDHNFLFFADQELMLKYLAQMLQGVENGRYYRDFSLDVKLDDKITLNVSCNKRRTISLSLSDEKGVYFINTENIHTVSLFENKIYLDGEPSQYIFQAGADREKIKTLLEYLHSKSVNNSNRCCTTAQRG